MSDSGEAGEQPPLFSRYKKGKINLPEFSDHDSEHSIVLRTSNSFPVRTGGGLRHRHNPKKAQARVAKEGY